MNNELLILNSELKNSRIYKKAQILVETIIGIGVVGILLSAIVPLFLVGLKAGPEAWKQDIAWNLGQEQIEAAHTLTSENWNNLYKPLGTANKTLANPYHLANNAGTWQIVAGADNTTINNIAFSKQIVIDNVSRTQVNGQGDIEQSYDAARDDPATQKITATVSWPGSVGVSIVDYFSRNINSTWVQQNWIGGTGFADWQDPPASRYALASNTHGSGSGVPANTDINTTVANQVTLAQIPGGAGTPWGEEFYIDATGSMSAQGSTNHRISMRFTAQQSESIDQIRLYAASSQSITFKYGLQANNAQGQPDGNWLSATTANFGNSNAAWRTLSIPSVNLTAGTVYHMVVQYESGNPDNRHISVYYSAHNNQKIPLDLTSDANANYLFYNGAAWVVENHQPIYMLGNTGNSTYEGNPYSTASTLNIRQNTFEGETFMTGVTPLTATGVSLYTARSNNSPPADSLYVNLDDITDPGNVIPLVTNQVAGDSITITSTALSWISANFSSPVTLTANHHFRIYFTSPGSTPGQNYVVMNPSTTNSAPYRDLTWGGTANVASRSTNAGGAWTANNNRDLSFYLVLNGGMQYVTDGELTSSTFNTANTQGAGYNRLMWNGQTNNGTIIKVQLAVNNDNATWNYVGPNGAGTWFTDASGTALPVSLSGYQYIRYKVRLETPDVQYAPILYWIRLNYSL